MVRNFDDGKHSQPSRLNQFAVLVIYVAVLAMLASPRETVGIGTPQSVALATADLDPQALSSRATTNDGTVSTALSVWPWTWWQRHAALAEATHGWWPAMPEPQAIASTPNPSWWRLHASVTVALAEGWWQQHTRQSQPTDALIAATAGAGIDRLYRLVSNDERGAAGTGEAPTDRFAVSARSRSPALCYASGFAGWRGEQVETDAADPLVSKVQANVTPADAPAAGLADAALLQRLRQGGFEPGAAVYLRIFKDSSTLEVWLQRQDRFVLFQRYDICRWSGSLGPKLFEGDRQSPEGYYVVDERLYNRRSWKWKNSFTINYPNAYDKLHGRTGSLILVHGGCTSSGCFAMTNPVIEEMHQLAAMARKRGQKLLHVSVYPFPLSNANMRRYQDSPWDDFWRNLKQGYDLFETTRLPPRVRVCDRRYAFAAGTAVQNDTADGFGDDCRTLVANIPGWRQAPARRLSRAVARIVRNGQLHATAGNLRCNLARPSCRKWAAMPGNHRPPQAKRSARRETLMRGAVGIGKRK